MSTFDADARRERQSREALIDALTLAGAKVIRGNTACCPWHDDRSPSGSIHQRGDGAWAFRCHVCDINEDVFGIRKRAGQPMTDNATSTRDDRPTEPKARKV